MKRSGLLLLGVLLFSGLISAHDAHAERDTSTTDARGLEQTGRPPMLAYYYIWFTPTSWNRAKADLPLLGKYSSEDTQVMREHIREAKRAGIDGFIVSWKDTSTLTGRLNKLIEVAREEDFHLAIIYQGLDVNRDPLLAEKVKHDVELFANTYSDDEVFHIWDKPVLIISGTWGFSAEEIASITESARSRLYVLSSERNVEGIRRLSSLVDGNAYYWSSVNPDTFPGYIEKLGSMADAVHETNGIWIAPFAPGFDARLIGGTSVVERKDGDTLRREYDAALQSSPDALGLISWNEFSENTHMEPSENLGATYLRILADILGTGSPSAIDFDSSAPEGRKRSIAGLVTIAGLVIITGLAAWVVVRRPLDQAPKD